ncbi:hypothetical protein B0T21DRAFT_346511 [Apiosordaria backusii]|uniref:Uncharacterized protein n=1 Tax=Apiosordaria backusii TaxID=314023 RepID=A0AA40BRP9_9PEZI|nr:hypothetical protein B0T21DRAFT_346511 [Apiosordaria backusii]
MPPRDPLWARRQMVHDSDFLVAGESLTDVVFVRVNTDVVRFPRCLISRRYRQSYMPVTTARMLGQQSREYPSRELTAEEVRMTRIVSPFGVLSSSRSLVAVIGIPRLSVGWEHIRFPVTHSALCQAKKISLILGEPFIEWYQFQRALQHERRLLFFAARAGPPYVQPPNNEMMPNGGRGEDQGQDAGGDANHWMQMQRQMPLVAVADEAMGLEGVVGPELNDGGQAHR